MKEMQTNSKRHARELKFWRAYLEILNERVPLVDRWRDGTATWHPRIVRETVLVQRNSKYEEKPKFCLPVVAQALHEDCGRIRSEICGRSDAAQ